MGKLTQAEQARFKRWEAERRRKEFEAGHCATCGALPLGKFSDGSPRFDCGPHPPTRAHVDPRCVANP